jgi:hypothetical protein
MTSPWWKVTSGAQRNEWKDITHFYYEWKNRRCSISTHTSTYFFRKQHLFSYTHTYVLIKALCIVKQHNILYDLHFSVTYYDVMHNNTWYVKWGIDQWKPYIGVCIWKQMLLTEEIGTFMCWYGTSPDLQLVI